MRNLSCHHRSQEVYSITTLKASHHFISQGTSPPYKDEQPRLRIPNDTQGLMEMVKRLPSTTDKDSQNLYV